MIVIYTPEGAEPEHYNAQDLLTSEASAVCSATDMQWAQVDQALRQQSPAAMRAVAWARRKRADPALRLAAFDPPLRTLQVKFATEDIPEFLRQLDRATYTPREREQAQQEVIDMALDPDAARKIIAESQAPKDPEPDPETQPAP